MGLIAAVGTAVTAVAASVGVAVAATGRRLVTHGATQGDGCLLCGGAPPPL